MGPASHWCFPVTGGLVLVRPDRPAFYFLNPTARLVWEDYVNQLPASHTVQLFQDLFGLPPDIAQRDIDETFAQWHRAGLFSSDPPPAPPIPPTPDPNPHVIDCSLNGKTFRILIDPGDLVDEIAPRLRHLQSSFDWPDFTLRVTPTADGLPSTARVLLLEEMTRLCQPGRQVKAILHAGAAGAESACLLLAGATHSGKSTLCARLMQSGWSCFSDDSAVLDQHFHVAGMPFPIMLREGSWSHFPDLQNAPKYLRFGVPVRFLPSNLLPHSPSIPAKALLFVSYDPAATIPTLDPVSTFDALVLLQHTGFWVQHDRPTIDEFLKWLEALPKYRFCY